MIAHRLSTVMNADNIVVLKQGHVIQQGTHEALLSDIEGPYWNLAHAQQLSTDAELPASSVTIDPEKAFMDSSLPATETAKPQTSSSPSNVGSNILKNEHLDSFTLFLWEQKSQWRWYILVLLGALGAGGE